MNLLSWLPGSSGGRPPAEMLWAWITILLSAVVAIGYCVIAVNWYFQSKLTNQTAQAKASLSRLRGIWLSCAICGYTLYATEMPWYLWRLYDAILLVLAARTWWFVFQIRGPGLVTELEESARKYREIAELLPHMVWTATADGVVDFSNQCWRNYCRGPSISGTERTWLDAVHPEERDAVLARWKKALIEREPMTVETRLAGGTGAYRSFVVKATPIVHHGATKWLGACADIEDQKLLAAQRELQAKQKSFFLNALSHDLRAPLHNVLLNAHLLKMSREPGEAGGEEAESVAMIMENAKAAGELVTRLLDFARVGAQDQNAIERVPLTGMLCQIARRFQPAAEAKGLYVMVHGDEEGIASSDRQKLDRIISNLVDNGIKYTQRGGVSMEVVGEEGTVAIRITDSGIGIPPEAAPFLFDEFYQVSNHERDRSKGFGMGLAICKALADQIGADVRLARTGGEGSCFEIRLRAANNVAAASNSEREPANGEQQQPAEPARDGPDRGGRPAGASGDHSHPAPAGFCGV
jgi:signal transduction histidine kinase